MVTNKVVLGIVGSPNREGRTNQLVKAALEGAAGAGAPTELVQMADHVVAACKDCLSRVCQENQKCTFEDQAFEHLSQKVLTAEPWSWAHRSILGYEWNGKIFHPEDVPRICSLGPSQGAAGGRDQHCWRYGQRFGLGVARQVYHFFQMMQMRALEPLPATRFNFGDAVRRAGDLGSQLAPLIRQRESFHQ